MAVIKETDGRFRRSAATREKIIAATISLIREGQVAPTSEMIALRAGVSARSIFFRFKDTADLYLTVIDHVIAEFLPKLPPMPTFGPSALRLRLFVDRRARSGEEFRHFWRTGLVLFSDHPAITARGDMVRMITRTRIATAFEPELAALAPERRESLIDAIATACDWEVWDMMRRYLGRSIDEAKATLFTLVSGALLSHGVAIEDATNDAWAPVAAE